MTEYRAANEIIEQGIILGPGTVDEDSLRDIQRRLNALGYTDDNGNELVVDGTWGNRTKQALIKLQTEYGIQTDGLAGPDTLMAIELEEAKQAVASLTEENKDDIVATTSDGQSITRENDAMLQIDEAQIELENNMVSHDGIKTLTSSEVLREQIRELGEELTIKADAALNKDKLTNEYGDEISSDLFDNNKQKGERIGSTLKSLSGMIGN